MSGELEEQPASSKAVVLSVRAGFGFLESILT